MKTFKTFIFNDTQEFAHPYYNEWATGELPCVLGSKATIEDAKLLYPNLDFTGISIIEIQYSVVFSSPTVDSCPTCGRVRTNPEFCSNGFHFIPPSPIDKESEPTAKELFSLSAKAILKSLDEEKIRSLEDELRQAREEIKILHSDLLERDAIWLPAKDAEIETLIEEIKQLKEKQ
jgi:hypothetical protein